MGEIPHLLRHQVDLVAQVAQAGVDRRRREHQHLGAHAVPDDFLQQPGVAASPDDGARLIRPVPALVAEVVGLINDDQIERAPDEPGGVDWSGLAFVAAQVGVRAHHVVEAVLLERVVAIVDPGRIAESVVLQLLGAEDENPFVAQFEELDDSKRRPGLAEAHAVGDDATVVPQQTVDGVGRPVRPVPRAAFGCSPRFERPSPLDTTRISPRRHCSSRGYEQAPGALLRWRRSESARFDTERRPAFRPHPWRLEPFRLRGMPAWARRPWLVPWMQHKSASNGAQPQVGGIVTEPLPPQIRACATDALGSSSYNATVFAPCPPNARVLVPSRSQAVWSGLEIAFA